MTYTELVEAALSYADRSDIEVTNAIDTFIVLAEAKMNRLLKTRKQSARIYTPTVEGQEFYSFPPDYSGMRDIQVNSELTFDQSHSSTPMSYMTPEQFNVKRNDPNGVNLYYTIIANQLQIYPKQEAGKTIEMVYYQKVPPLSESAASNWMSEDNPDAYLAGVVAEIELFVKNYEVASSWNGRMISAIDEIDNADELERWSGSQLIVRLG